MKMLEITDRNIHALLETLRTPKERRAVREKQNTIREYQGKPIWTADAETDPFKIGRLPEPFIWGLYTGEEYFEFTDTDDFLDFVSEQEAIVYAHNGGKFDWHFISHHINHFEPVTIIGSRLAKFKIGACEFRDSYNLIPSPLSAYKKDDIDYAIMEADVRHEPENWQKIRDYLKGDCVYLHELITAFVDEYGMHLTQAGAAMKTWAAMEGIKPPQSTSFYYADIARFYYGGRTECFERGIIERDFSVVDINSAYPFAMIHEHPWGMEYDTYNEMPEWFDDDDISRSFITLKCDSFGAFPFRGDNGLGFPADGNRRIFTVTGWEYLAARDTGTLSNAVITEVLAYSETINFRKYVDHFFNMKAEAKKTGDIGRYIFAKIFLNALYGKFAANPENYDEFEVIPADLLAGAFDEGWFFCQMLGQDSAIVNKPLGIEKRRYYDVAIGASITGFVRAYLWRNICSCKIPLYCDTDSIAAVDVSGVALSDNLGDWDLEAECDYAAIAGKKLYAFRKKNVPREKRWKLASKGVKLTHKEIIRVAKGETVLYETDVPTFSIKRERKFVNRNIRMT